MSSEGIRIGIDIGGTFTDFALDKDDHFHTTKVLTTHQAPEQAIMNGLQTIMSQTASKPEDVELIIHGTTLATNAIIEQKGARVAMLTTMGFRDVLELGTESRFDQYDLNLVKPKPLVERAARFTISERLAADGSVLLPIDLAAIKEIAGELDKNKIESVAICFLHSFTNPQHEQKAADELRKYLPNIYISLSSQVAPEIREYERFSTTVANAYVQPLMDSYLCRLEQQLQQAGYNCPVYMFLSNGGLAEVNVARQFPIRLVESGPAGGAVFASHVARSHKENRILSFDMGGTTAKICLIDNAEPQKANMFEMARVHRFKQGSGLPARIPVIEMVEIGAGGGSIARVDNLGRITVGPDSAGSEPGPACYDRGGDNVTVTDSDLTLGRLEADGFADGSMKLNSEASKQAIQHNLSEPLEMDVALAAFGVAEIVEEDMANAAREHATESGKSLTDRTLIAFGGAAPIHALPLASKLGIDRVIIPDSAGVGSAVGFLLAPVAFELSRSCRVRLSQFQVKDLNDLLQEMSTYTHGVVESGAPDHDRSEIRQAQMRYVGQGYNIPVDIPIRALEQNDATFIEEAFNNTYINLYKKLHEGVDIEIVGLTVSVSAFLVSADAVESTAPGELDQAEIDHKTLMFNAQAGDYQQVNVYSRAKLQAGNQLSGPGLVRDLGTTVMVPDGYVVTVATDNSLIIERQSST
jgi:N-methylhydantoinase A